MLFSLVYVVFLFKLLLHLIHELGYHCTRKFFSSQQFTMMIFTYNRIS